MSADDAKGQTGFFHYMEARMITWSPKKLSAVINTHEDWGSCLSPLLSPGSMSCYCKLNQGEVCGFPVFPHSDVWGQTGSIYRVCPRFFKESPRPASCNQAAEAYVSGQERWMNSGCGTESSAKIKTDRSFFLFEVGAEKEVLWKENSGRQTCCVSLVNNQSYIWYAWYKNVWN